MIAKKKKSVNPKKKKSHSSWHLNYAWWDLRQRTSSAVSIFLTHRNMFQRCNKCVLFKLKKKKKKESVYGRARMWVISQNSWVNSNIQPKPELRPTTHTSFLSKGVVIKRKEYRWRAKVDMGELAKISLLRMKFSFGITAC